MKKWGKANVLIKETVFCEGLQLRYVFGYRPGERQFFIFAECGGDSAMAQLGDDPNFAACSYRTIRDGGVTPCTLEDVVSDLRAEQEKFPKALYKF